MSTKLVVNKIIKGSKPQMIRDIVKYVRDPDNQKQLFNDFGTFDVAAFARQLPSVHGRTFGSVEDANIEDQVHHLVSKYTGKGDAGVTEENLLAEIEGLLAV